MCFFTPPLIIPNDKAWNYIYVIRVLLPIHLGIMLCLFFSRLYPDGIFELVLLLEGLIVVAFRTSRGIDLLSVVIYQFFVLFYLIWGIMRLIFFFAERDLAHRKWDNLQPWQKDSFLVAMYVIPVQGLLLLIFLILLHSALRAIFNNSPLAGDVDPFFGMPRHPAYTRVAQSDDGGSGNHGGGGDGGGQSYLQPNVGGARNNRGGASQGGPGSRPASYNFQSTRGYTLGGEDGASTGKGDV